MTPSNTVFVACPCSICEGESVKQSVAIKHQKDAELAKRQVACRLMPIVNAPLARSNSDGAIDGLVHEVFRWTLGGRTSSIQWKLGSTNFCNHNIPTYELSAQFPNQG